MPSRRLLFVNYEFPPVGGGGGTCSKHLARELVLRGHEVEVITAHYGKLPRKSVSEGMTITRLRSLRRRPGQSNPIEMASYIAAAAPYLLFRRGPVPDVAVSFHSIPSGMAVFPLCILRRVPHIILFQGGDIPGWLPGSLELYHKLTLPLNRQIVYRADAAIANSNGLRNLAMKSFTEREIGVLYGGADTRLFCPPAAGRAGRSGTVRLLMVGRLTPQKGVDAMLPALAKEWLRAKDWQLDIVGDGPQRGEYEELARSLGLQDRVRFHGWLGRPQVRAMYRRADVLVHPSRSEGMPNVVLEGMASGLPVIGTAIAGTEQLVQEGINGFLARVDDVEVLAQSTARLLDDPQLRLRMGDASRQSVLANWSWSARAEQLESVMEEVLARRGKGH